ncbi:hypothetical protein [Serratia fonticola]|uniref:hypothetical protein n=1 Tax=Serratia fonticola TaxID=47917 RepID=UPI00192D081E|nr:hypothetical protein [Serratia fonticola]MBL5828020.1 hypothetical protein [Serratia fonticola]
MSVQIYKEKPFLKIGEFDNKHGEKAYIYFEEYLRIPGLEKSDIRLEFENAKSYEEVSKILKTLKEAGLIFVAQNSN